MNIDIKKIRKKLDKLDVKLLHIIKERSLLVDQVVKLKKKKKKWWTDQE
jgi:chorismate mutase